jgi:hypothetical protein
VSKDEGQCNCPAKERKKKNLAMGCKGVPETKTDRQTDRRSQLLNSTQLNSTQLNSTQLNSTQLNSVFVGLVVLVKKISKEAWPSRFGGFNLRQNGLESRGMRILERLLWQGPAAAVNYRPVFSSERSVRNKKTRHSLKKI